MSFNFEKFCRDHSIVFVTEGEKHCREGWIQVECPFCTGNIGWHLGFDTVHDRFHCWRCGSHRHIDVIAKLANISSKDAGRLWNQYKGRPVRRKFNRGPLVRDIKVKLPPGCSTLKKQHRKYLKQRDFNPKDIALTWGLLGTGMFGPYKNRIIAPIYYKHELISYQGRDITNRSKLRYKACAKKDERQDHKTVLYGFDLVPSNTIVIVEGITDVWRLGPGAVATFGIKYTPAQVDLMKQFKNRFILFDDADPQAQKQSRLLGNTLSAYKGSTNIIELKDADPGSMNQKDADDLMTDLLGDL